MSKPLLIVITPVRNEAWCLDVFLTCASLWADHIIIADQGSTDGSREIAKKYPKVILIENKDTELHETNRQRLLFNEARKIPGDKVFIALDADEVFTANFQETNDWEKISNAKPGDIFNFKWANIEEDCKHYTISGWSQWAFFDEGTNPPKEGYIHIARVPWPQNSTPNEHFVNDFRVIHLQKIFYDRTVSKNIFYQYYTKIKEPKKSAISLYRTYNKKPKEELLEIPNHFLDNYLKLGIDIFKGLNLSATIHWQDLEIIEYIKEYGQKYFQYIFINQSWYDKINNHLDGINLKNKRTLLAKLLYFYLHSTKNISNSLLIRTIDKVLKVII